MRLRILGTRGNIESSAPRHIKHSGILVDDMLLFDLGEKEYLSLKPRCIFITHLHTDHAVLTSEGVHNGIPDLVKFFSRFTRFIVITHFGTWFFKDVAKSQRKLESLGSKSVRIIVAYDGMKLDVSRLVFRAA